MDPERLRRGPGLFQGTYNREVMMDHIGIHRYLSLHNIQNYSTYVSSLTFSFHIYPLNYLSLSIPIGLCIFLCIRKNDTSYAYMNDTYIVCIRKNIGLYTGQWTYIDEALAHSWR